MKDQCVICGKNGPVWDHLDDMCHDCTHDELERVRKEREQFKDALLPLVAIADAYHDNRLDDEARKFWGKNDEHQNTKDPAQIELYCSRGGGRLLTLAHCLRAKEL